MLVPSSNQRIVYVSELFSNNEDSITSGDSLICYCVYGNCSCSSLDRVLANLTNKILINITTDVTLSSLVIRTFTELFLQCYNTKLYFSAICRTSNCTVRNIRCYNINNCKFVNNSHYTEAMVQLYIIHH